MSVAHVGVLLGPNGTVNGLAGLLDAECARRGAPPGPGVVRNAGADRQHRAVAFIPLHTQYVIAK
jgi:hypothetical protein